MHPRTPGTHLGIFLKQLADPAENDVDDFVAAAEKGLLGISQQLDLILHRLLKGMPAAETRTVKVNGKHKNADHREGLLGPTSAVNTSGKEERFLGGILI